MCWFERSSRQSIFAKLKEEGILPTRHFPVKVHQSCTANMDLSWIQNFGIPVRVSCFKYQNGLNQILLKCVPVLAQICLYCVLEPVCLTVRLNHSRPLVLQCLCHGVLGRQARSPAAGPAVWIGVLKPPGPTFYRIGHR